MPLISVIIPVFNGEKTILETIESVLNQTFTDIELIVIDDGSRDSTLSVVSKVRDPRLKIFSYTNAGVANSRNRGLSHASGKFVAFLDADDLWTPDKLEAQLKALMENPQAAVAYSWVDYIDQSGKFFRAANRVAITGDLYEKMLVNSVLENGSNPLIRKQAFAEVGGFNQEFSPADDWDMWLRLSARYHFVAVPAPQILYRMSPCSASSNVLKMESACLKMLKEAFNQAPESLQYLKKNALAGLYRYLVSRALESPQERKNGLLAARFFWHLVVNNLSVLTQWKTVLITLSRVGAVILLPPMQSQRLMMAARRVLK